MNHKASVSGLARPAGRRRLHRSLLAATILCGLSSVAPAAEDSGQAALDRVRYMRSFNEIHDKLANDEAARAAAAQPSAPWTSAEAAPPKGTRREIPGSMFHATVAAPSPGSWRGAGDDCTMAAAGIVTVLGSAPDMGTLVRYARPRSPAPDAASACGDGTLAFIPTATLFGWPGAGESQATRRDAGARLETVASRILSGQPTE